MKQRSKGGAYPHDEAALPFNIYFAWGGEQNDKFFIDAMKEGESIISKQAIAEGQFTAQSMPVKYGNYAFADEDLES